MAFQNSGDTQYGLVLDQSYEGGSDIDLVSGMALPSNWTPSHLHAGGISGSSFWNDPSQWDDASVFSPDPFIYIKPF